MLLLIVDVLCSPTVLSLLSVPVTGTRCVSDRPRWECWLVVLEVVNVRCSPAASPAFSVPETGTECGGPRGEF